MDDSLRNSKWMKCNIMSSTVEEAAGAEFISLSFILSMTKHVHNFMKICLFLLEIKVLFILPTYALL